MPHVTFIHGIANKPPPDILLSLWRQSLARDEGIDLGAEGVTSSMVYWADVMYNEPKNEMAAHESNDSIIERLDNDLEMDWLAAAEGDELVWTQSLRSKFNYDATPPDGNIEFAPQESGFESANFERIPLPWWLKRRLMETLLRDVHHYLFNAEHSPAPGREYRVQEEIRGRFVNDLLRVSARSRPHLVVSHSMGTVIAYDCLKRVQECPPIDGLMTIGSPLGLDEVQDKLRPEWSREDGFPEKVSGEWINIYDKLDPVAGFDPKINNDFRNSGREVVQDINEQNSGAWRHNISKYLEGKKLRRALNKQLGF